MGYFGPVHRLPLFHTDLFVVGLLCNLDLVVQQVEAEDLLLVLVVGSGETAADSLVEDRLETPLALGHSAGVVSGLQACDFAVMLQEVEEPSQCTGTTVGGLEGLVPESM